MKNIVVFGPPAAGKGTIAKYLEKEYDLKHLSTGHIFRTEFYNKPRYKKLKEEMEAGLLAPDRLAERIVEQFLDNRDIKNGVIFDGFPRNVEQADVFERILKDRGFKIDVVFDLDISEDIVYKRICGRYSCMDCGASYHKDFNPTKLPHACDHCGSDRLLRREEDSPEILHERMEQYYTRTMPLIEYYTEKGLICKIDASQSLESVQKQVDKCLNKK